MQTELRPGEDLEHLVEGAESARQGQKGIGERGHARLAFVHAAGKHEFAQAAMGHFAADEEIWNDARDSSAGGECGIGDQTHQPDVAAAVHDFNVQAS